MSKSEAEELRAKVERLEAENAALREERDAARSEVAKLHTMIVGARKRKRPERDTVVGHVQNGVEFALRSARDVPLRELRFLGRMGPRGWEEEVRHVPPGQEGEGRLVNYNLTPIWPTEQPAEERQALLPLGKPAPAAPAPQAPAPAAKLAEKPKRTRKPRKVAAEGATT